MSKLLKLVIIIFHDKKKKSLKISCVVVIWFRIETADGPLYAGWNTFSLSITESSIKPQDILSIRCIPILSIGVYSWHIQPVTIIYECNF